VDVGEVRDAPEIQGETRRGHDGVGLVSTAGHTYASATDLLHLPDLDPHPREREPRTPVLPRGSAEKDGYRPGQVFEEALALEEDHLDLVSGAVPEAAGGSDASRSGPDDGYPEHGFPTPDL
jgi:hypothetical protein